MTKQYIYVIELLKTVKIGMSVNPWERIQNVKVGISENIKKLHVYEVQNHKLVEEQLHAKFNTERLEGEWFTKTPHILPLTTKFIENIHKGKKIQ
jgi:hypothetical protein